MRFSRRGFLGLLAAGAVGACVATKIPTALLPAPVRTRAACEFLRKAYNDFCHGRADRHPWALLVGRELFEAFEGEIIANERFVSFETLNTGIDALKFKSADVVAHPATGLRGWQVMPLTREQWVKAKADLLAGRSLQWVSNAA